MSTKINVRSPFYLNITEPTVPQPTFTCDTAYISNLSIDQQGQISTPILAYGELDSITSTDGDFSNGKFATVTTATSRTLTLRILIPSGFSNVEDGYIDCVQTVTQPAYVTSGPTPSCSGGPTTSGSIPSQSLDIDGDSTTIDLTSYFTAGSEPIAGYTISNTKTNIVNASVSGDTLSLSSNSIGGAATIHISAYDDGTNTCTATQSVSVTVTAPGTNFDCNLANLTGGSIAQDGTITNPNTAAQINFISETEGGSSISSYDANDTGSPRSVTLWFNLTAPAQYANAGSTINCSKTFTQPAGDPDFDCEVANLSGQQISTSGVINPGSASIGTISDWSPKSFSSSPTDIQRSVTFYVTPPASGYSNSGGSDIPCVKTITQPASAPVCGTNLFHLTVGFKFIEDICKTTTFSSKTVYSTSSNINATGARICENDTPFNGRGYYYAVAPKPILVGENLGLFTAWRIDGNGIVQEVLEWNCGSSASGDLGLGFGSGLGSKI